jgi:hypothetical protein
MDDAQLEMLQRCICCKDFVEMLDVFRSKKITLTVPIQDCTKPHGPFKVQLAAVMGQMRVRCYAKSEQGTNENRQ